MQLAELGYEVVVEKVSGESASFPDGAYPEAGALIVGADKAWGSEVVLGSKPPTEEGIARLADGATLIGMLAPGSARGILATVESILLYQSFR